MKRTYWYVVIAVVLAILAFTALANTAYAGNAADAHKPGKDLHDVYEYTKQVHTYANGNSEAIKYHGKEIKDIKADAALRAQYILKNSQGIQHLAGHKLDKTEFVTDQARQDAVAAEHGKAIDANHKHTVAVQGAAQAANEKADANAVRSDRIEGSLAVTDNRSINNAVRLDGVEKGVGAVNGRVDGVVKETGELKARANQADLGIEEIKAVNVAQGKTLDEHGSRLDGHDAQFAGMTNVNSALNTRLGGAYQRLDAHEQRISGLERDMDKANEANAISLAVAGHQFDTKGGFQTAVSVSTVNGREALAIGMGGSLSERVFINAGVANSGNTTGGVVSSTYSW